MLRASFVLYVPALSAKRMARFKIFMISSAPRSHGIMHICLKRRILSFLMMVCMSWKLQDERQQKPQQWCQHMGCRNRDPRPQKKDTKGSIKKKNVVPVISLVVDGAILKHFDHVGRCQWFHVFQLFVRLFQYFFLRFPLQFLFANVPKNQKKKQKENIRRATACTTCTTCSKHTWALFKNVHLQNIFSLHFFDHALQFHVADDS